MPTDPPQAPVDPKPGQAYRDPANPRDRYVFDPGDDGEYGPDEWSWQWTRNGHHEDWLKASELPAGLVPVEDIQPSQPDSAR